MKTLPCLTALLLVLVSCNTSSRIDNVDVDNPKRQYTLKLSAQPGSVYNYHVNNKTELDLEVDEKEVHNENEADVRFQYQVIKDTGGNYQFNIGYKTIRIQSDNGQQNSVIDADNASVSIDPVERMLGQIKSAQIVATVAPGGNVIRVTGLAELGEKFLQIVNPADEQARENARKQFEKMMGEKLVNNNLQQLFQIFPDSTVRTGDKWKIKSQQPGDLALAANNFFQLKTINDDIALIESNGEIFTDGVPAALSGAGFSADIKGTQEGTYELEAKSGMLRSATIVSKLKGTLQTMGREVPVSIKIRVSIKGELLK